MNARSRNAGYGSTGAALPACRRACCPWKVSRDKSICGGVLRMIVSVSEIILTILALILGWIFIVKFSVPQFLEWLDCMCIDDTSVRKEEEYE